MGPRIGFTYPNLTAFNRDRDTLSSALQHQANAIEAEAIVRQLERRIGLYQPGDATLNEISSEFST
jgi:hypothetical protein